MGDRSKSAIYTELLAFMEQHGVSLGDAGVSYRGLDQDAALEFLALLARHNVVPLGLDVWRHTPRGYSMESLAGWACSSSGTAHKEAHGVVAAARLGPRDVVSFQY